jgi:hypothetical protein
MLSFGLLFDIARNCLQQQRQRKRSVDQQVAVALDVPCIVSVEVNEVGVEG